MTGENERRVRLGELVRDSIERLGEQAIADFAAEDDPTLSGATGQMMGVLAAQNRATHESLIAIADALDVLAEHQGVTFREPGQRSPEG